jgi:hypothetical protein
MFFKPFHNGNQKRSDFVLLHHLMPGRESRKQSLFGKRSGDFRVKFDLTLQQQLLELLRVFPELFLSAAANCFRGKLPLQFHR